MVETENQLRRRLRLTQEINTLRADRPRLEKMYGQVWDTEQLQKDFVVLGFLAPFVQVRRRSDGNKGTLMFQHSPRFYFQWEGE